MHISEVLMQTVVVSTHKKIAFDMSYQVTIKMQSITLAYLQWCPFKQNFSSNYCTVQLHSSIRRGEFSPSTLKNRILK